jgi:hypothetical protein
MYSIRDLSRREILMMSAVLAGSSAQMHSDDSVRRPLLVFPAKAGTQFCHGHRPSPVWLDFDLSVVRRDQVNLLNGSEH